MDYLVFVIVFDETLAMIHIIPAIYILLYMWEYI